jgi:hypothetical protein
MSKQTDRCIFYVRTGEARWKRANCYNCEAAAAATSTVKAKANLCREFKCRFPASQYVGLFHPIFFIVFVLGN